ncbi:MAG: hypothetical protein EOO43_15080 [Flavobacterium sp.]|nr:MAG: hypothetical protein EOO43_15080 [Flavobacterium sp.]
MIQATSALEDTSFVSSDTQSFTFELFLDSGLTLQKRLFVDGYFQFMTAVDQIGNASLASFVTPQNSNDQVLNKFRYVVRNGYGPLREGAGTMMDNFQKYFTERRDHYDKTFLTILIITEIIIAIAALVSTPFIFATLQANDKILSLFGYIPIHEIESRVEEGERFREKYLEFDGSIDYIGEDVSFDGDGQSVNHINPRTTSQEYASETPNESRIHHDINESEDPDMQYIDENIKEVPVAFNIQSPTTPGYKQTTMEMATGRDLLAANSARFLLTNRNQVNNEEDISKKNPRRSVSNNKENKQIIDDERKPKSIKTEERNKRLVIFVVVIVTLFWVLAFILSYIFFERWFLQGIERVYGHIILNSKRTSSFIYLNGFVTEELSNINTTAIYAYPGI